MSLKVGVIIVNFKGDKDTLECLDSLALVKSKNQIEAYVVNYDFRDSVVEIGEHKVKPKIISEKRNLGFSGFNNLGIRQALADGCDVVVLLNNDTTVSPLFLDPLVDRSLEKGVGLVSPKIYFSADRETYSYPKKYIGKVLWYAGGVFDWRHVVGFHLGVDEVDRGQFDTPKEIDFATGCCVAVSRKNFDKIGYLDDRYFLYLEDVEWSLRARALGFKNLYDPSSVVWHKNAGSTGGSGSKTHLYYQTRNRLYLGLRQAPWRIRLALLRQSLGQLVVGEETVRKGVVDGVLGRMGRNERVSK